MKKLSSDELKKIEFDILTYVKKVCEENNIRFFLFAGTMLGAVRHNGFIPWDDDIDIALPRTEYEKLLEILRHSEEYRLIDPEDVSCFYPFAKLCDKSTVLYEYNYPVIEGMGVYIDIFPLDGMPEDREQQKAHIALIKNRWKRISRSYPDRRLLKDHGIKGLLKASGKICYSKFTDKTAIKKAMTDAMKKYSYEESPRVGYLFNYNRPFHVKSTFERSVDMDFEGVSFPVPEGYDKVLTDLYGDYMELPPEEKRVAKHDFDAYRL